MAVRGWICAALFVAYGHAFAQGGPPARIGFISAASKQAIAERTAAFQRGLRELGYVEGKNIQVEYRWADSRPDRLRDLVREVASLKVDVLVASGPQVTRAAKEAGVTMPVVMAFDNDPVGSRFVSSLSRPGGNITGLSTLSPETSRKQLEILKEMLPKLSRVVILEDATVPGNASALSEMQKAARHLDIELLSIDARAVGSFREMFAAAKERRAGALVVMLSPLATPRRAEIVALARESRLPTMYFEDQFVERGGLVAYGANIPDLFRRAATYVDRILKGAKPASLPVEQPTKFDLVVNANAAKELGLTISPAMLARADRVIY